MTPLQANPIFGFPKGGYITYDKPFLLPNDGFQTLQNAVVFRDRVEKRLGIEFIGRLRRIFSDINYFLSGTSPWSFNIKVLTGFVIAANNANPGKITTSYPHGLSTGDKVILSDVGGATGYNNTTFTITVVDTTNFTVGANAAGFGAYTSGGTWISNRSLTATEPNAEIEPGSFSMTIGSGMGAITFTDSADGLITSTTMGNYGYINYVTGAVTLTHTAGSGVATTLSYNYYPSLPVMSISYRDVPGINDEQTIFFDTRYAYIYESGAFQEFIPGTSWFGSDSDFFWTTNYQGATSADRLFFETNFAPDANDPMYYTDGSTWTEFQPQVDSTPNYLFTALILLPYYGRLIALNTYEGANVAGASNYFSRCRFSAIGSPIGSNSWRSDIFGQGGFIDAPINEQIIGAEFVRNTLIVFFEESTWQLRYVGEYGLPFLWERISSDFGAEATFSPVLFKDSILAVGDTAIIGATATDVDRLDIQIPDFVFNINNANAGPERVHGIRDYYNELIYWCYSDSNTQSKFPDYVLVYNYRNQTYAIFRDNVTCFGYFRTPTAITWSNQSVLWDDDTVLWDDPQTQGEFPAIVGGNAQGFIFYYAYTIPDQQSLTITAIDRSQTPPVITSTNHNLLTGDIIQINGMQFIDTGVMPPVVVTTSLNGELYYVQYLTANTFAILKWDGEEYAADFSYTPANGAGTYIGGGTITVFPTMLVQTKDFNPYIQQGLQTKASFFDFLMDIPLGSGGPVEFTVQVNVNSSPSVISNIIIGNKEVQTTPTSAVNVPGSAYLWQRFYANLNGQFFSLTFTYDNSLLNDIVTHENGWVLNAITLYSRPGSRNMF